MLVRHEPGKTGHRKIMKDVAGFAKALRRCSEKGRELQQVKVGILLDIAASLQSPHVPLSPSSEYRCLICSIILLS